MHYFYFTEHISAIENQASRAQNKPHFTAPESSISHEQILNNHGSQTYHSHCSFVATPRSYKALLYKVQCFIRISGTGKTDNLTCEIIYDNFTCENNRFSNNHQS